MRHTLATLAFALSLSGCGAAPSASTAKETDSLGDYSGVALYSSHIPAEQFQLTAQPNTWGKQKQTEWCWAASSQMILNYYGLPIVQDEIVAHLYGSLLNQPASLPNIVADLNNWQRQDLAQHWHTIGAQSYTTLDPVWIVQMLHANAPFLVGLSNPGVGGGHAYVATGVSWYKNPYTNAVVLTSVTLRDPWPTNPSETTLTPTDFAARFLGVVAIAVN